MCFFKSCLQVGCHVILIQNLSDVNVNGLRGSVVEIRESAVTVKFGDRQVSVCRRTQTRFDPHVQKPLASRIQYPFLLAYGK